MATQRDPYDGFKDDDQRRRALKVQAICSTISVAFKSLALMAALYAGNTVISKAALLWLRHSP